MNTNVLIVDDSPTLRAIIQHYISEIPNLTFYEAADGLEAEAKVQEMLFTDDPINLVLLDWNMPKATGLDFLRKIRSSHHFQIKPYVIMLTAEAYPEQRAECATFGVFGYITKPFVRDELVKTVVAALKAEKEDLDVI